MEQQNIEPQAQNNSKIMLIIIGVLVILLITITTFSFWQRTNIRLQAEKEQAELIRLREELEEVKEKEMIIKDEITDFDVQINEAEKVLRETKGEEEVAVSELIQVDPLVDYIVLGSKPYNIPSLVLQENNPEVGDKIILELFDNENHDCFISRVNINIMGTFSVTCRFNERGHAIFSTTEEQTLGSISDITRSTRYQVVYNDSEKQHYLNKIEEIYY